jgi:Tfp pilus assembly pilus retraction ATPase PilT
LHTVDTEDILKADNLADNFEEEREVDFSYVAREVPIDFLYRDYKSIINQQQEAVSRSSYSRKPYGAFLGRTRTLP